MLSCADRVKPQTALAMFVLPFKKSALIANLFRRFLFLSLLVRLKSGSGFHAGHGWFFALSEGTSSSVCFWVPLFSQIFAAVCLDRLKSTNCVFAVGALRPAFLQSRSAIVRLILGVSGLGRPEARCFSLSFSSLVVPFVFLVFGAATHFLMSRPLLR